MKKVLLIIRKIVIGLCMLYTFNVLVSKTGFVAPINIYSLIIVSVFGLPGMISLLVLKILLF